MMKNLYAFIILAFLSFEGHAQTVNIPDVNFKNRLIAADSFIDLNHDGEIQVSEALEVTSLNVRGYQNTPINDLTGIEAFTNLTNLECSSNNLTTLNVSALTNLQELRCSMNQLMSLDMTGLTALTFLDCRFNQLTELNLPAALGLKSLWCNYNLLTSLDVIPFVNLEDFECGDNLITTLDTSSLSHVTNMNCRVNQLTSLDLTAMTSLMQLDCNTNALTSLNISGLSSLKYLQCHVNQLATLDISSQVDLYSMIAYSNQLTSIDLSHPNKLKIIDLSNNLFTSLDLSHLVLSYPEGQFPPYQYRVGNNPNLTYLNIKNGIRLNYMYGGQTHWSSFNAAGSNNLAYICADEFNFVYIDTAPQALVNPYCTFTPGGTYNTITGKFTLDLNNNGCDENDYHLPNTKIQTNNNGVIRSEFTNASGNYTFYPQVGTFVVSPVFENPYFTVSPPSATITFADNNSHVETQNFCLLPNGVHNDVEITILPIQLLRPGFDVQYRLVYKNKGNQTLSGNINFTFNDAVLDFVAANPALGNQSLNTLNWTYSDLLPFESREISITLNANSPQEIPALVIGNILNFTASIDPVSGDETVPDNTFALAQMVRGSMDPNDKTCLEGETITPEMVGDYLHYVVRFQNSGTAPAENVVVKDIIDTAKFDMASVQLTGSSHPHLTKITGNTVEFQFPNINLPAEMDDEPGSHGFVAFKIKTKGDLVIGNSIENKADIYFDYNFPIETNTATTTVALLKKNTFENKSVSIFPNPVKDELHITAKENITSVQLCDVQGRLISTAFENSNSVVFDLGKHTSGVYFVKVYTNNGVKVEKVIKQ